jgi:hypothetical protein
MPHNADTLTELRGVDPRALPEEVLTSSEPIVLRGLAAQWPLVKAARESAHSAAT